MKPTYGVVAHGVPIRSITDMDKEAVIRKFELENRRALGNHRIVDWRWLKPPKEKQRDASLVLEFETAPGANTAIHAEVLCWDSTHKRTEKYDRACQVRRCFKCYQYGHIGTQCRETETCGRCAAQDHNTKDCKAKQVKCCLCQGKHTAWSPACSIYRKETARVEEAKARLHANPYWPENPVYISPGPSEMGSRSSSQRSFPPLSPQTTESTANTTNQTDGMETETTDRSDKRRAIRSPTGSPNGKPSQEGETDNGNLERDTSPIRMERSDRNIAKAKPSTKSRKNKPNDDATTSRSKSRNGANSRREKEKEKERETVEIVMDEQAEIEDEGSSLSRSSQYSTRSLGKVPTLPRTDISGRS